MSGLSIFDRLQAGHLTLNGVVGKEFPHPERAHVIAVTNQKDGVGETLTVMNLTVALAKGGLYAPLINADSQDSASTALEMRHGESNIFIHDTLVGTISIKNIIAKTRFCESLWCTPATIDMATIKIELISIAERESRLRCTPADYLISRETDGLEPLNYVIIDCPPSLSIMIINALAVTNGALIPMQVGHYILEGLALPTRSIDRIAHIHNPGLGVSMVVLIMFNRRTTLAREVGSEARSYFPDTTLDTKVSRSIRVAEAPSFDALVMLWDPRPTDAITYKKMAREVALRSTPRTEDEEA